MNQAKLLATSLVKIGGHSLLRFLTIVALAFATLTKNRERVRTTYAVKTSAILMLVVTVLATVVVTGPPPAAAQGSRVSVGAASCSNELGTVIATVQNNNDERMPIWVRLRKGGVDLANPHLLFSVQANSIGSQELTGIPNGTYDVQVIWGSPYLPSSTFLASSQRTFSCAPTETVLAKPSWLARSLTVEGSDSVTARWNSVSGRSSYHVQWSDDRIPIPVKTGITGTSSTLGLGGRTGEICAQVRAIGTGNYVSSGYNEPECVTIKTQLAKPSVNTPTISGSTATVRWNAVPNHASYLVRWSINNVNQPNQTAGRNTTTRSLILPANTVGTVCAEVRAIGTGNYTTSPWQDEKCVTVRATLAEPSWLARSLTMNGTNSVTARWNSVSGRSSYHVQWSDDRIPIPVKTGITGTSSTLGLGGRTGEICAQVRAIGTGNYVSSGYNEPECVTVKTQLAKPSISTPTISGSTATVRWRGVPNHASYQIRWSINNVNQSNQTAGRNTTTRSLILPANTVGTVCAEVRAIGTGNYTTSPWQDEKCVTVKATLAEPSWLARSLTINGTNSVTARWNHVPGRLNYHVQWSDDRIPIPVQTGILGNMSSINLGDRTGQICAQVRAIGTGNYMSSGYNKPECVTIATQLARPVVNTPTISGSTATVTWRGVPNHASYQIRWSINNVNQPIQTAPRDASTKSFNLPANTTGTVCVEVRAIGGGGYTTSPWQDEKCAAPIKVLSTPTWRSNGVFLSQDRTSLTALWFPHSLADRYEITWIHEDTPITPNSSTTDSVDFFELGDRTGNICAVITAIGSGQYRSSGPTEPRCKEVVATFAPPAWSRPVVSSVDGSDLVASWRRPATPTNVVPFRYKVQWYLDNKFIDYGRVNALTHSTPIEGRGGDFCAIVRAEATADVMQSSFAKRTCVTVLASPDVTIVSPELATWAVDTKASGYTARWTDNDGKLFNFDELGEDASSSESGVGSRTGQICVQVRAEGSGTTIDSEYSAKECTSAERKLQSPVERGISFDAATNEAKLAWLRVAGAERYLVTWTLNGETWTSDVETLFASTDEIDGQTGLLCATVEATSSKEGVTSSEPTRITCIDLQPSMDTPRGLALTYLGRSDQINATWDSTGPSQEYKVRWFEDNSADPFDEVSAATNGSRFDLAGRAGPICAEVKTVGSGDRASSPYSAETCLNVQAAAPKWAEPALTVLPNFDAPKTVEADWLPVSDTDRYLLQWYVNDERQQQRYNYPSEDDDATAATFDLEDETGKICLIVRNQDTGVWGAPSTEQCVDVAAATDRQLAAPEATMAGNEAGQLVVHFDPVDNASAYELRVYYGGDSDSNHDATSEASASSGQVSIPIDQAQNQGWTCVAVVAIGQESYISSEPGLRVCTDTTDYFSTLGIGDAHERMTLSEVYASINQFEAAAQIDSLVKPDVAGALTLERITSEDVDELLINSPTHDQDDRITTISRAIGPRRMDTYFDHMQSSIRFRNPSFVRYIELMTPVAYLRGAGEVYKFEEQYLVSTGQKATGATSVGLQLAGTEYPFGSLRGAKLLSGLGAVVGVGSLIHEFAVGGLGDSTQDYFEISSVFFGVLSSGTPLGLFFAGIAVISGLVSIFLPDKVVIVPEPTDRTSKVLAYLGAERLVLPPYDPDRLSESMAETYDRLERKVVTCGFSSCPGAESSAPSELGVSNRPATRYVLAETNLYDGSDFKLAVTVFPPGRDTPAQLQYSNGCGPEASDQLQFAFVSRHLGLMRC